VACSSPITEIGFANENVPVGSAITSHAPCPDSQLQPTGGGISSTADDVVFSTSYPDDPDFGWFGLARNLGGGIAPVTYYAVCTDSYDSRYRFESVKVKPGEAGKVTARCRADEAVLGGGVASLYKGFPSAGPKATATKPWDSKDDKKTVPDDGWQVKIYNGGVSKVDLQAHAVCKRGLNPT
jgi:hypothetical protein